MLAIAIQKINASYHLIQSAKEYVLCVPGPDLARETLYCGVKSMSEVDKVKALKIQLIQSERVSVPGLQAALANIEMVKEVSLQTGDHVLVVGRVVDFRVNNRIRPLPLISMGPETSGYTILAQHGIHRIGTVKVS
jgi:flavin reductase (DIM6/NTAB) family NADH-FMN oxidoreductase RutF